MTRIVSVLTLLLLCFAGEAWSQPADTISGTTITTSPAGLSVTIDGKNYITPVKFLWPAGSKHFIVFPTLLNGGADEGAHLDRDTRYTLGNVLIRSLTTATPFSVTGNTVNYTADPNLYEVGAVYQAEFRLRIVYYDCGPGHSDLNGTPCPETSSPGKVVVTSGSASTSGCPAPFTMSGSCWTTAGTLGLEAYPNQTPDGNGSPGWVFAGFYPHTFAESQAFLNSVLVTGPTSIYPRFVKGRRVRIESEPSGLKVAVDRTEIQAPQTLTWGWTTKHTLGVIREQMDNSGKFWAFDSWSDGGTETHAVEVPTGYQPDPLVYTAKFVRAVAVRFLTSPANVRLDIDGGFNRQGVLYRWAAGSTHTVVAPLTHKDATGRTWRFKSWSNGGEATQTITIPPEAVDVGLEFTAVYEPEAQISIQSSTPGVAIQVDGESCSLPCVVRRDPGTTVTLVAPTSVGSGGGSRIDYIGWSDEFPSNERTVTPEYAAVNLTVNYQTRHQLNVQIDPPEGVKLSIQPESADGYYDAHTAVEVSIEPKKGFKFLRWEWDASGASRTLQLTMDKPKSVNALLERVPAILANGVKNAAAETPVNAVAPGSIAAIYGVNMATELVKGPDAPLAQTLGQVIVRLGSRLLPLFFVSPEQINVQLPPDLSEGANRITVRLEGKPEISADFDVLRNAPGIFHTLVDGRAFALALHADGTPVTIDSPAKLDEVVTLLGTGFGPLLVTPPAGFPLPEDPNFRNADAVELWAGEARVETLYAGAAAGRIAMNAVRFRVAGEGFPATSAVPLKVRINERESNVVLLPVE